MSLLAILAIAVGLAMDAFAVSLGIGLKQCQVSTRTTLRLAWHVGLFLSHPNPTRYPHQRVLVVAADDYARLVPFVEEDDYLFLKTIIPSRKATRDYLQEGDADDQD
jgi:hypothetical protein